MGQETTEQRKARFLLMRDMIGLTQGQFGDDIDAAANTIKNWETPGNSYEPSQKAWDHMEQLVHRQDTWVNHTVGRHKPDTIAFFCYIRAQGNTGRHTRKQLTYNAHARALAQALSQANIPYNIGYINEDEAPDKPRVTYRTADSKS
jgi:DNA-binding XRE family transcriptional regulator